MTYHILLVEDDKLLAPTLKERLEKELYSVIWVDSCQEATHQLKTQSYDLVILDVGLPDGSGFTLTKEFHGKNENTPFIFVTALASAPYRLEGFERGAAEYIPKPFHLKEFLLRVKHVLESHSHKKQWRFDDKVLDLEQMSLLTSDGQTHFMAARDFSLLRFLIESSPKILSRDDILNRLWGEENFPSNRTVDNTIVRLRQILSDDGTKYIRSVRGIGYQWLRER